MKNSLETKLGIFVAITVIAALLIIEKLGSTDVFSHGGGLRTAKQMDVHFLGELPLDPQIRIGGDSGQPIVQRKGEGEAFLTLARNAVARLDEVGQEQGPKIEIGE